MILVVCKDDNELLEKALQQSNEDEAIFGECNILEFSGELPDPLDISENLFVTSHGSMNWEENNSVIGDREVTDYYFNGVTFFNRIKNIFPDNYQGKIYISACESADHSFSYFSFIEVFKSQIDVYYPVSVYGQKGKVDYIIPYPNDPSWVKA